jgi:hypothetical protein
MRHVSETGSCVVFDRQPPALPVTPGGDGDDDNGDVDHGDGGQTQSTFQQESVGVYPCFVSN